MVHELVRYMKKKGCLCFRFSKFSFKNIAKISLSFLNYKQLEPQILLIVPGVLETDTGGIR